MSTNPSPTPEIALQPAQEPAKQELFKVELDDRCLLFPDGKIAQHLIIGCGPRGRIHIDLVFAFNRTRLSPRIATLTLEDAKEFSRDLSAAVYQARSGVFLSDQWKININVIANGYYLEFITEDRRTELFLSVSVIWRVIKALLMAVDAASPVVAH